MSDLPRVTRILQAVGLGPDLSAVPVDVLEAARDRGVRIHEAVEALVYGYLDDLTIDAETEPYVDAYKKFVADSGYEAQYAEIEVRHEAWRYRGHPDNVGWILGKRILIDLKSGGAERVQYQLAGYKAAWDAQRPTEPVDSIAAVLLRRDRSYRFIEYVYDDAAPIFFAAATVFHARGDE